MDLFWMGFPLNASLCWISSPCPWPRPWIGSRVGFPGTESWPLLLQDGLTAEYKCNHVVQCVQKPQGAREINHFLFQKKKKMFFMLQVKWKSFFLHVSSRLKKFLYVSSDWKIFFSGGKHVSFHVSNVISEKVFSFLCQDEWKSIFFSCEKFFFMCRANWKKILFSCVESGEKKKKNCFLVSSRVKKNIFFFQLPDWVMHFFFMCRDEWKCFLFFFYVSRQVRKMSFSQVKIFFHLSSQVKKVFTLVKLFFFLCQAEWNFFFFHGCTFFFSCAETSKKPFLSYLVNRSENDAHYFAVQPHGKPFRAFVG